MTHSDNDTSPAFHSGETDVQTKLGVADKMAPIGKRVIRDFMLDQHREFYAQLPMLLVGAIDSDGRPWASPAFGHPGFLSTPHPNQLDMASSPLLRDMLNLSLARNDKLACLGIQLETRRRNRMNGVIIEASAQHISVQVEQSFGNCPQYIQRRHIRLTPPKKAADIQVLSALTPDALTLISSRDTFFITSRTQAFSTDPRSGLDVSHRGGRPGFVTKNAAGAVSFPDFSGNRFFNTIGNILDDPRVGLFFPNFQTGDAVFLTGRAEIIWEGEELAAFDGAQRFVNVTPDHIIYARQVLPLSATYMDQWPALSQTGIWHARGTST